MILIIAFLVSGAPAEASPNTIERQLALIEERCGDAAALRKRPPVHPASDEYQEGIFSTTLVGAVELGIAALDRVFASKQTLCAGPNGIALACRDFTAPDWERSEAAILARLREMRDEAGLDRFQSACLTHCALHALLSYDEGLAHDVDDVRNGEKSGAERAAALGRSVLRSYGNLGTTYVNVLENPGGSTGQCREFAHVGTRLLRGMGHKAIAVGSVAQAHAWVLVLINGHLYHLDTTMKSCAFWRHGEPQPAPRKLTPEEVAALAALPRAENGDAEEGPDTEDGSYNDDVNWEE